jgi:K+-transporting ATPase ATPase A chain
VAGSRPSPIERLIYRLTGVDEAREMRWTEYAVAMLLFSAVSMLVLYLMQRVQQWLSWNPQAFGAVPPDLAFSTAASFTTNTNWQAYSGESTMSYLTQMAGLAYHNFISAAVGISLAIAFIRGIAQKEKDTLGNFWVDMVRCTLWVLPAVLHRRIAGARLTRGRSEPATVRQSGPAGLERASHCPGPPSHRRKSSRSSGPTAAGFMNANSAHPFENPTPFSNFFEMVCIFADLSRDSLTRLAR